MIWITVAISLLSFTRTEGFVTRAVAWSRSGDTALSLIAAPLVQDVCTSGFALCASALWLKLWISLAQEGKIDSKLSRKIIHVGSAPLFLCLWPLYSSSDPSSRLVASTVPLVQMGKLILAAGQKSQAQQQEADKTRNANAVSDTDFNIADTVSRSGNRREALGGPLIYTIVLTLATLLYFRNSPVGIVAICQMAAGDGFADIVGRRWGRDKWPFSASKSYVGSAAFVAGAFLVTSLMLYLMTATGCMQLDLYAALPRLLAISVFCALVELVPGTDDNISVPVAAAAAASITLF